MKKSFFVEGVITGVFVTFALVAVYFIAANSQADCENGQAIEMRPTVTGVERAQEVASCL